MEDLQRQITTAGAICLVYGVEGVGKTRLIRQFIATRSAGRNTIFCRLAVEGVFLGDDTQSHPYEKIMPGLIELLSSNSIWVIDQLELAPKEFIQQLLHHWSLYASKLNCALILGCRSYHLAVLHQISEQLTLKIPSIELSPFSNSESLQYLFTRLCPNMESISEISRELNKQLKIAGGVPGKLEQIIQRHTGRIECKKQQLASHKAKVPILLFASLLLGSLGAYTYLLPNSDPFSSGSSRQTDQLDESQSLTFEAEQQTDPKIPDLVESMVAVSDEEIAEDSGKLINSRVDVRPAANVSVESGVVSADSGDEEIKGSENLLQDRLLATKLWLQQSSDSTASIQIMSLGPGISKDNSLSEFLDRVAANGDDLKQIYIYKINKTRNHIFVVLFGSYSDRIEASSTINNLPAYLKANSPLVRTVLGINNELNENHN